MGAELRGVVVVLPGIMGSVLQDADGDDVWKISKGTLLKGVLTGGRAIKRLQLPEGIGDDHPGDGVRATALMPDLHVLPGIWTVTIGYERLLSWFRSTFDTVEPAAGSDGSEPGGSGPFVNFVPFPYDWRLSNRYNAQVLKRTVEPILERFRSQPGHEDAKITFVGHSMGGLVARYYVDVLGGHEVTDKVITLGTPHRGAANVLESLVNGVKKGFGPVGLDLTAMARSMPALFQLLPEYACIEGSSGLQKTTEVTLPEVSTSMILDAMRFHEELSDGGAAHARNYASHPILARTQPTATTARIEGGRVTLIRTIDGNDELGDGTVPRLSAAPYGVAATNPILRYVMDKHGALPKNDAVLVELEGVLTGTDVIARPAAIEIGVSADDVLVAGEPLIVEVESQPDLVMEAELVAAETGARTALRTITGEGGRYRTTFDALIPGGYELKVRVSGAGGSEVTTPVVVFEPATAADPT